MTKKSKDGRLKQLMRLGICVALIALIALVGVVMASAEDAMYSQGLAFKSNGDGTCSVSGIGTCTDTELVIPPVSPYGDSVTSISDYAFRDCSGLTSINIPQSVTSIGHAAFINCDGLREIIIPGQIKIIGPEAFLDCDNLIRVDILDGVEFIDFSAFSGCDKLVIVSMADSVKEMSFGVFEYCPVLEYVKLSDSIEVLPPIFPFSGIKEVGWPANLKIIEHDVFYGCESLRSICFPASVVLIEDCLLSSCINLESVTVDPLNPVYHSAGNCIIETETKTIIAGCNSSVIPADGSVTTIGWNAFNDMSFSSITIPSTITRIQPGAFDYCENLTDVYYLGTEAEWKKVTIERGNEKLLNATIHFLGDQDVNYSQGLVFTSYGNGTCYISGRGTCTDADLIIPALSPDGDRVTRIKNETFANCSWLTSVTIPEGVTSLGEGAFKSCKNLTSVSIPDSMQTVSKDVFTGCTKLFQIENGVKYVDDWAVGYVTGMTEAKLREGTKGIAECAFVQCDSMIALSIPESVMYIGQYAFSGCTALESIYYNARELHHSFSDYNFVFYDAGKNGGGIEVVIGACVERIPAQIFSPYYSYSTDYSVHAPKIVSVVFEEGSVCKAIYGSAFRGCRNLKTIILPEGLTYLDGSAFSGCSSLTSLPIPDSVTYVANGWCVGGSVIQTENGVSYWDTWVVGHDGSAIVILRPGTVGICEWVFDNENLLTMYIPASLKHIEYEAFGCMSGTLGDLYYEGTKQEWRAIDISECNYMLGTARYHFLGDLFDLTAASLSLGESLTMNYYAKADPAYNNVKMRFTYRGVTVTVDGTLHDASGEYVFSLKGIAPQYMSENIKAELIYVTEDGTEIVVDVKESYSIRQYCDDALAANPNNEALTTLLADLLAYGDAAQDYANYNEDTPVSEGFTVTPSEWEDVTDTDFTLTDATREDTRFTAAGVRFGYVNRLYFKIQAADLTGVTVTVNGKAYSAEDLEPVENADGTYILYTDAVYATEFDKIFTAELTVDGEVIQTVTYSVKSYVFAKQNGNDDMAALAKALYNYGRSALAYKNAQ